MSRRRDPVEVAREVVEGLAEVENRKEACEEAMKTFKQFRGSVTVSTVEEAQEYDRLKKEKQGCERLKNEYGDLLASTGLPEGVWLEVPTEEGTIHVKWFQSGNNSGLSHHLTKKSKVTG